MYEISCLIDEGVGGHGNDDRAVINDHVITIGTYETTADDDILAIVCDGVGGEAYGNEAAEAAVTCFSKIYPSAFTPDSIPGFMDVADGRIQELRRQDKMHSKMASTVAGIYLSGNSFAVFNIGDSRVYRYRKPYIAQLSRDQSLEMEMRELGLTPKPGQEHVITKYLGGANHTPEIMDGTGHLLKGDIFFLCSDGISDVFPDEDLEEVFSSNRSLAEMCRYLADEAMRRGSMDNLTAIIIRPAAEDAAAEEDDEAEY